MQWKPSDQKSVDVFTRPLSVGALTVKSKLPRKECHRTSWMSQQLLQSFPNESKRRVDKFHGTEHVTRSAYLTCLADF
jgi:hypothetical protein